MEGFRGVVAVKAPTVSIEDRTGERGRALQTFNTGWMIFTFWCRRGIGPHSGNAQTLAEARSP